MWQTRSNSNVHVAVLFAGLPPRVATPNITTILPLGTVSEAFFFLQML
jgi:hypothetical protein